MKPMHVLALNRGSSSLKVGHYRVQADQAEALRMETLSLAELGQDLDAAMLRIRQSLRDAGVPPPEAVGHRIVHGGPRLSRPCVIDAGVLEELERAIAFAPLHLPASLALIDSAAKGFPNLPQVACFDTGFHADMPEVARRLPLPQELHAVGIRRYGFHGLSCESIVHQLGQALPRRLVIAHLGQGSSITAVRDGRSIDTSMGLTPSGGVIMGTRSGDLDPGVLIDLVRRQQLDAAGLEELINRRSGLLGISGLSGDMRELRKAAASNREAALAIEMFCYSARKQIAAMIAVLGGIDRLVFTGGIGENDAGVRDAICAGLSCFGFDPHASSSGPSSACVIEVRAPREEQQIARHVGAVLAAM